MIKWFVFFYFVLSSTCVAEEIYQTRYWLNLLYYEKSGDRYQSLADDDSFFVAGTSAKTDPKLEYEASVKLANRQDPGFRTKFPLRYKFIARFNAFPYLPLVTPNEDIVSAMVVFPNRYMANPASMFGHIFFILKSRHGLMDSEILHYLADTSGTDEYAYVFNGLTGRFKGRFLSEPYFKKIKEYNFVEDREIIYYDLKLTPDQIENLQLHGLELRQTYFDYYFLDENCAFFTGKLLNVILTEDILTRSPLVFPSQIINTLIEKSLLTNEYRRKPSTKEFNENFHRLNAEGQSEVVDLILKPTENVRCGEEVLKTFLYISEHLINTQSQLADTIRQNRIQAYKRLSAEARTEIRPANVKQTYVLPIRSKGVSVAYGLPNQCSFSYRPIYYGEFDSFGDQEIKKMNCLAPRLILQPTRPPLVEITLADLVILTQHNVVLGTYSWRLKSALAYRQSLLADQSIELGQAYPFLDGLTFGFLGFNLASYDPIIDRELNALIFRPSLSLGVETPLYSDTSSASIGYDYRFGKNYLMAKISLKALDLVHQLSYVRTEDFDGWRLSATSIF